MAFRQIFRIAFIALIWKQYKGLIVSSVLLIAYLFLVSSVHQDYLTHSQLQNDTSGSGMSFIYKWAAYALGIALYFGFHALSPSRPQKDELSEKAKQANRNAKNDQDDPFSAIRERETLRSRADFIEQEKQ